MARTPDSRRGDAFRRWLRGLPPTARRLVVAGLVLGWLAFWYAAIYVVRRAVGDDDVSWADPLSSMIGPLIGIALVLWLRRRQMGSFRRVWDFDDAARRSRLPEDADPAEWEPLLEGAQRFQRGARTLALWFTALTVVAVVAVAAWAGYGWVVVVAAVLIGAALLAVLDVASRRQVARIRLLQEQLRSR